MKLLARGLLPKFCFLAFALASSTRLSVATEVEVMPRETPYPRAQAVAAAPTDQSESPVPKAKRAKHPRTEADEDDEDTPAPKSRRAAKSRPTPPVEPQRPTGGPPSSSARSVIMINAGTGQVLYEKNADEQRAAASTQKLLTALIVAEHGFLDRPVAVEQIDTMAEPVKLNIKPGETYQRIELLRALLVKSPNDVARCLARDQAGSNEAFAMLMNEKARELGATHSHFVNPNGLPVPNQYSSARDLSIIAKAAYANAVIRSIVCLPRLVFRYANGRVRELENTNKVLGRSPYCNGMKTGYTEAAGHCLICSGSRPGRDVIVVVLGDSKAGVWRDASALLSWGLWL
jgi:D-alanyl-D-alanine carboxypeptidase (penicillin-binding protein 5/6)